MSRIDYSGSSREWSHLYSDHSACSPNTCGVARARELVRGIQRSVWLDESSGVLLPRVQQVVDGERGVDQKKLSNLLETVFGPDNYHVRVSDSDCTVEKQVARLLMF
jgi:hypothetical protein